MWVGTRTLRNRIDSSLNRRTLAPAWLPVACFLLLAGAARPASAQTTTTAVTKVHDFGGTGDGFLPTGPLILGADGVSIVGTTKEGGTNNLGTVFSYMPPTGTATTGTYTTLYSFSLLTSSKNTDGAAPVGGVILDTTDGNYYGCATQGGANGYGTIFKLTPSGTLTKLYDFKGTDGKAPIGLAQSISDATVFYGTTMTGTNDLGSGVDATGGTVFQMTLPSSGTATVTTLHTFSPYSATASGASNTDGSQPVAGPTLDASGNVFGTAESGGHGGSTTLAIDGGTIWEVTSAGTFVSPVFYDFPAVSGGMGINTQGSYPTAPLTLTSDGTFIGTAELGGNDDGTVFRITPTGTFTVLHTFAAAGGGTNNANVGGDGPYGGVIEDPSDGTIYGTTTAGGTNGYGTVFSISSAGKFTDIYDFAKITGIGSQCTMVLGADGNLYGTTTSGGSNNPTTITGIASNGGGTLFAYAVNTGGPTVASLNPSTVQAGASAFTILITGTGFDSSSVVDWQTTPGATVAPPLTVLPSTVVSSTQLTATIPASLVASDPALLAGTPETHNITVVTTAGTTRPLSFTVLPVGPPILNALSPTAIIAGSGSTALTITGSGFGTGTTVSVAGTVLTPSQITPVQVVVTIPPSLLLKPGTVFVTATSVYGTSNALTIPVSPLTTYAGGLQMIALPYDYPGVALSTIFGYASPKLAVWNAATNAYAVTPTAPADAIRLGRGYWVRFPATTNVQLSGTPAAIGVSHTITLNKGWNMIGDPFLTTVAGTGITVVTSANTAYTYSDAASAGIINRTLYRYIPSANQYLGDDSGQLQPFVGYWLYAGVACSLVVNGS